jgi:hypothetical protein
MADTAVEAKKTGWIIWQGGKKVNQRSSTQ